MASDVRYTAIPATLWAGDSPFVTQLSARAQWLYLLLWTSEERDSAGFVPYQPTLWARCSKTTSPDTVRASVEELCGEGWLLVDEHMEKAWLCRFIADDTYNNPNFYTSALKAIRTCRSGLLRQAAWKEAQRLGLPPVKSPNPDTAARMAGRMQTAWDALATQMLHAGDTPSIPLRSPLDTPSKGPNVNANAHGHGAASDQPCQQCGERPAQGGEVAVWPHLCVQCSDAAKDPTMRGQR